LSDLARPPDDRAPPHFEHLPAIRWKVQSLEKLREADPERFAQQFKTLADLLV